jgi:hypothetical protein
MTPLFRYFLALVVLCLIGAAAVDAATLEATCAPPTTNTDSTPITKPITYTFHWGTSAASLTNTVNASTCSATITVPDPAAGTSVTYHVGVKAIVDSVPSAMSNVVSVVKSTPKPTPSPPVLRVVEPTAYRLDQGYKNKPQFKVAGLIPLGTLCHPIAQATDVTGATYQLTERTVVTPIGSLPLVAFAKCG